MALVAKAGNDSDRILTMSRTFDAPRDMVFRAWFDPKQVALWLGSREVRPEVKQWDARAGGSYCVVMHGCDSGNIWTVRGIFCEVAAPERLVFTWVWDHDKASETQVTVTLRAVGNKTELVLLHEFFPSADIRDRHTHGWVASLDKIAEVLAGKSVTT